MSEPIPAPPTRAVGFGSGEFDTSAPPALSRRIRRTIWAGVAVVVVFVVGLGTWAMVSPISGAVPAQGVVKVQNNRKTLKHLEPGILRRIYVHEGDHVRAGQLLFEFDASQSQAQLDVLQSQYDSLLAERARFQAEATGAGAIRTPPELAARMNDPAVAAVLQTQQALFEARRDALRSQMEVGRQREQEIGMQISGLKAQVAATDAQDAYNTDELNGVQQLYAGGYAPKTRLLALQRQAAGLKGSRGEQVAAIARAQETIGETRVQTLNVRQQRIAEAATGLQETSDKLAEVSPRLAAARDALAHARVFSPADGYVLNLTQFTEGGVVNAGEPMLDIVPSNAPLVIQVQVRPQDAHAVHPGQRSLITLTAYNTRTTPRIEAEVVSVAADQTLPQTAGAVAEGSASRTPYFLVEMRIPPDQLKRLPADVKIYPGMPVSTSIVTGKRTIMDYLLQPMKDSLSASMHEQ